MLTKTETSHRSNDAMPGGWVWEPFLKNATSWNSNMGSLFTEFSAEYWDFVLRRGMEDVALPSRLMSCKSPVECMQVYQAFFEKASRDYQDEFAAFSRIGKKILNADAN